MKQLDTLTHTYLDLKSSQKINLINLGRLNNQFRTEIPILERACRTFDNEIFIKINTFYRELRKIKSSVADQQYTINEIKLDRIRKSN